MSRAGVVAVVVVLTGCSSTSVNRDAPSGSGGSVSAGTSGSTGVVSGSNSGGVSRGGTDPGGTDPGEANAGRATVGGDTAARRSAGGGGDRGGDGIAGDGSSGGSGASGTGGDGTGSVGTGGARTGGTAGGGLEPGGADAGGASTGGASTGGAGGASTPLDCPLDCLPPPPPTWTGPSAVYDGPESGSPALRPDRYSLEEVRAHQGMTASPGSRVCLPGVLSGEYCNVTVTKSDGGFCTSGSTVTQKTYRIPGDSTCVTVRNSARFMVEVSDVVFDEAVCTFDAPVADIPPPEFEGVNVACGLPVTAACPGRPDCTSAPLPSAPFGRLCIHKDGDQPCPDGNYPVRFLAHRTLTDTRDCSDCEGAPVGGSCGDSVTSVSLSDTGTCVPSSRGSAPLGQCESLGAMQDYVNLAPLVPFGQPAIRASLPRSARRSPSTRSRSAASGDAIGRSSLPARGRARGHPGWMP